MSGDLRSAAMFALAIDSKLRASDLVRLLVRDVAEHDASGVMKIRARCKVIQKKTDNEVAFEIGTETASSLRARLAASDKTEVDRLFTSYRSGWRALSTRQYERVIKDWVQLVGLNPMKYGTHSLRRTKVALLYKQT